MASIVRLALSGVALWQGAVALHQQSERDRKYSEASQMAHELGKPFLVVGGPYGSPISSLLLGAAHGCGDVCVDIAPESCNDCQVYIQADIRDLPFDDGEFGSVFASHILEHMPSCEDFHQAVRELLRVADVAYICVPSKQSLWAWLVPDHYLWVAQHGRSITATERRRGRTITMDDDGSWWWKEQ